ncbi:MAG: TonB-dependent receptor [Alphaproteobacteria bacterium]|nr:TonB-dependent receptor [Alphaproteobacteria bacterium]MBU1515873.1 TonB-dependent receptor [Alphaproteobacteria bacterium]MBU2094095.1 TonB-dependent receptor [Alphaproteobacteria bacterium]MBU2151447.1 TonB-dependent receptor [Alphaproteobacteria bacterium]MBU2305277.1 TonB-dependent receptor [Alphaproteobacteria bacterium]
MGRHTRAALLSASTLAGLSFAAPAFAQTGGDANVIQELIVTAQKRAESAQDVPVALTAVSGDALQRQGVTGFQDLGTRIPSLRFGSGVTGGENVITLRGVGSQNTTGGGDSPVAYSVDGVYLARTTSVDPEFFDVDRIEVLRGPQGTLYGRNSVGGSVNVITKRPTTELGGHVDAAFGNYDAQTYRAWVNVPFVDTGDYQVLGRLAAVRAVHDGYQENLFKGPGAKNDADGRDFWMVRGELFFKLGEHADLLLVGSASSNGDPVATKTRWSLAPGRFTGAQPYLTDPRKVRKDFPETFDQDGQTWGATFNYDAGFATLTSVTGYAKSKWRQASDADGSELNIATNPYWTLDSFQYSEEVRVASNPSESPLSWILGGFYFQEKVGQTFLFIDTGLNSASPLTDNFTFQNGGIYKTTSWAPFGQVDFDLAKTGAGIPLTITVGLRYSHDKKEGFDFLDYRLPRLGLAFPNSKTFDKSWSQTTGKVGLAYQVNDDVMLYANASRGYLSGGGLVGNFPGIYQPETVTAYEAGFKSTLMERRVQLNVAAYHQKIKDMQVFVQDIAGSRIDNAGKAHVKGLEAELIATPAHGLRLNLATTATEAEYDDYTTINNRFAGSPLVSFAGNRLVQTPKYTISAGAEYAIATPIGEVTPRVDIFRSGDLYFLSANSPFDRQGAYTLVDANVRWRSANARYSVEAFVRNLTNKDIISNDGLQSNTIGGGFGPDNYTYYPPRTFGVRLGVDF